MHRPVRLISNNKKKHPDTAVHTLTHIHTDTQHITGSAAHIGVDYHVVTLHLTPTDNKLWRDVRWGRREETEKQKTNNMHDLKLPACTLLFVACILWILFLCKHSSSPRTRACLFAQCECAWRRAWRIWCSAGWAGWILHETYLQLLKSQHYGIHDSTPSVKGDGIHFPTSVQHLYWWMSAHTNHTTHQTRFL